MLLQWIILMMVIMMKKEYEISVSNKHSMRTKYIDKSDKRGLCLLQASSFFARFSIKKRIEQRWEYQEQQESE